MERTGLNLMDPFFVNLEELQREKASLVQRLEEHQAQRQALERELEEVEQNYAQVDSKHHRMSEALTIAQKKMDQCITNSSRLQEEIDIQKATKKSVMESCEMEKSAMVDYMNSFQTTLANIANDLFQARDFHRETALTSEIAETEKIRHETEAIVEQSDKEIEDLNCCIENLSMKEKTCLRDRDVKLMMDQVIRAITEDKREKESHFFQLHAEVNELREAVQREEESA